METNILSKLLQLMEPPNSTFIVPIIRILSNIAAGPGEYSNILVNAGILDCI